MTDKKKLVVQIPDEIIRNKGIELDTYSFTTYVLLKFLHFRNYNKDEMEIDHNHLKHKLYISDNRTLKKVLAILHMNQFILEYINRLPSRGSLKLTFDPIPFKSKKFTQLPITVLNKIEHIGNVGVRLLFYYESFINRKEQLVKQFAFPGIETISSDLGLDQNTIIKYNTILKEHGLLKIDKHKLEHDFEYDDFGDLLFTKYNNHYYVQINNL